MLKIREDGIIVLTNRYGCFLGTIRKHTERSLWYFEVYSYKLSKGVLPPYPMGENRLPFAVAGFTEASIDALYCKLLNYGASGGIWPWCHSKQDVLIILNFLSELSDNFINLTFHIDD